jgi:hypothetical protein
LPKEFVSVEFTSYPSVEIIDHRDDDFTFQMIE